MSIRNEFGLHEVTATVIGKHLRAETLEATGVETINNPRCVGIEIEVENHRLKAEPSNYVWSPVGDGSLRNNGEEWITQPIAATDAPRALYELLNVCLSDECCFGPRTSTHVHINAQDLSVQKVKNIVLLYSVFERVLYNFVGKGRVKNIYCVPLYDTSLMRNFHSKSMNALTESWSKYTGLNLIPLRDKGTLEFRHMHGSSDHVKISRWIRILLKLFEYVTEPDFKQKKFDEMCKLIGPDFDFHTLFHEVFKEDTAVLPPFRGWPDVKVQVLALQQAYASNDIVGALYRQRVVESPFYQFGVK